MDKSRITVLIQCSFLAITFFLMHPFLVDLPVQIKANSRTASQLFPLDIPVLVYHSVHPLREGETQEQIQYNVPPEIFEEQLRYLRDNGYVTITMGELEEYLQFGTTTEKKLVALTFDDGWQDQYVRVYPLLKQYGQVATFYVYTNPIGKDYRFLTWDEIREMKAGGMSFGSHSLSHPFLSRLNTDEMREEILRSKEVLEKKLGSRVTSFAYPFGDMNKEIMTVVNEAGYISARGTHNKTLYTWEDSYDLPGYFAPQTMRDFIRIVKGRK